MPLIITTPFRTTGWSLAGPTLVDSFYVGDQGISHRGLTFRPDGTQMFISNANTQEVFGYTLSVPWDITSTSFDGSPGNSFDPNQSQLRGMTFKPDGTEMYVIGDFQNRVYQFSLSVAWDLSSTALLATGFATITTQDTQPDTPTFKPDGTRMYVTGTTNDSIYEYSLSPAWDVSSASHLQTITPGLSNPAGIAFSSDGTKMFVVDRSDFFVREYALSPAWDISSYILLNSFNTSSYDTLMYGIYFKPDGSKMYLQGSTNDRVYEFDL